MGTAAYSARVRFRIRVGGGSAFLSRVSGGRAFPPTFLAAGSTFPNVEPSERGKEVGVLFD